MLLLSEWVIQFRNIKICNKIANIYINLKVKPPYQFFEFTCYYLDNELFKFFVHGYLCTFLAFILHVFVFISFIFLLKKHP